MSDEDGFSNTAKPVRVYPTKTALWDIQSYQIPKTAVQRMARSLADMPVSERDIFEGTIRYRQFGDWVAIFHHSSSSDAFIIDVIGFRPPVVLSKSEEEE